MFLTLALAAAALLVAALLIPSLAVWSLFLADQIRIRLTGARRELAGGVARRARS